MMSRCTDPKHENFKHYGGKGIGVCEQWKSFAAFLKDMGPRPKGKVLDRKENSDGYHKGNCRWVTKKKSTENRSITIWLNGERVNDIAKRLKMPASRIYSRRLRGWTIEEIEKHAAKIPHGWTKTGVINPQENSRKARLSAI